MSLIAAVVLTAAIFLITCLRRDDRGMDYT